MPRRLAFFPRSWPSRRGGCSPLRFAAPPHVPVSPAAGLGRRCAWRRPARGCLSRRGASRRCALRRRVRGCLSRRGAWPPLRLRRAGWVLGAVTGLRGRCLGLLSLYVPNTGPSGPSPPVEGLGRGRWGWALGVQGGLRTRRGGSNRSRKGCEAPLRGHNSAGGGRYSRSPATSGVRGYDARPHSPAHSPNGRGRAGGALFVDVKRQQSTNKAPEARHRTQQHPSPPQAQRRTTTAAGQPGTCGAPQSATASNPHGGRDGYVGRSPDGLSRGGP